jgi:hypothetical protein
MNNNNFAFPLAISGTKEELAEPTLYDRIASGEVKQVWCKAYGVSKRIELDDVRNKKVSYPISVWFERVDSLTFTENGIHDRGLPTQTECNITPYTEPAQSETAKIKINSFRDEFMAGIQAATYHIYSLEKIIDEADARIAELVAENSKLMQSNAKIKAEIEQAGKALQDAINKLSKLNIHSL